MEKFDRARPVWPAGRSREMNVTAGFKAVIATDAAQSATLRITASSLYRFYVNGTFGGHGPARGPHGYYRLDEWDIAGLLRGGDNVIAIEVAGYNVNSYYLLNQPSFVQAEVLVNGAVEAATSATDGGFQAIVLEERVQKVQRYSFQRPFAEYYRLRPESTRWRVETGSIETAEKCEELEAKTIIPRGISYSTFQKRSPVRLLAGGGISLDLDRATYWKDRSLTNIGRTLRGYTENELQVEMSKELQQLRTGSHKEQPVAYTDESAFDLEPLTYRIVDFGINRTGFIGATIHCAEAAKLYLAFDEILTEDGDVDFKRLDCVNGIGYELEPGVYELESFEPYTLRYAKLIVARGACRIEDLYIREYVNPDADRATFRCDRGGLNRLFDAAAETFRQNASDLFMDCPSRERAGWLCDSYFISRTAYWLTGDAAMERNFLGNYALPEQFAALPPGMLPMCYPADHDDGVFIPNWALWFVLQLEEYAARTGDAALVAKVKAKVYALFAYFAPFLNEDGLLEKLKSWVFVEWSKANDYTQDVNYPSNMLYAGALSAAGRLYGDPTLLEQAAQIRETIAAQSFNGAFFVDNAVRVEGRLVTTEHTTEVCQYYAFFFGVATPETYPSLWQVLAERFGPDRGTTGAYPDVHVANAFVGNYMRLDLFSDCGKGSQLLSEMEGYFAHMAERTGTLWENTGAQASCDHGFASHVVHWLYRSALGLHEVNHHTRQIVIRFENNGLQQCEGAIPAGNEVIALQWEARSDDTLVYRLNVPNGYAVVIVNDSGKTLVSA
ncbi:alpha-L-rhamnosidase-related protein [Paenibacillus cymbidii]|uniref:alpha-L-rhamnosidase-related protein n=1 Tax=Paenibacillus cymbidii TaxID=1639034 RepID=UPI0010807C84|nr:family 78 glycoside hydrolase catalytic domain [Paenibacillus cymbidii]